MPAVPARRNEETTMRNEQTFATLAAANAFADSIPESFDSVSVLTNTPTVGTFAVRWGMLDDNKSLEQQFAESIKEHLSAEEKEETTRRSATATREIAAEVAHEYGHAGRDAEMFVYGFTKWPAKVVNPRAEGREPIFRAGRSAWVKPDVQQRIRARIAQLRGLGA